MKRFILLSCVFIFIVFASYSQNLKGKVFDENEKPMFSANIQVKGSSIGTTSNENGEFGLNLKQGKYVLQVSFVGYETDEVNVEIGKNPVNLDVKLMPRTILTDEIIVNATRAGTKSPMAYFNIDLEGIKHRNSTGDIPQLLELTPSFVSTSESGNGVGNTAFRIRGADATRINVTVNGIPLNDSESQAVFWANMPDFASSVSSLQIQRGVGTSSNGAAAFGASMNFETNVTERKPYAEVNLVAGSFNTFKENIALGTGIMDNGFSFDVKMSKLDTDGYVDRSFADNHSFFMSGAWRNNKNLIRANIIHGKQLTGLSYYGINADSLETNRRYNEAGEYYDKNGKRRYYENESSNYTQTHYHLIYSRELTRHLNLNAAAHYTRGFGYYEQYRYNKKLLSYGFNSSNKTDLVTRKNMLNDFYGISYSLNYNKDKINLVFGGATNQYDGHHYGNVIWMLDSFENEANKEYYRNSGLKNDINNFLKIDYSILSNLSIYADIQHRYITYKMSGRDDKLMPDNSQRVLDQEHQFSFINPKAGVFYDINESMNVYASFAIGNREPTRTHFKDATGDVNNQPKSERLYDYELGWRFNNAKLLSAVNLYYMDYLNQIIPTGEKNSVGYDIMTNAPESYRMGVELSVAWQILKNLSFSANTTLSRNKIKNYVQWASSYDENWNELYVSYNLGETDIALSPSIIGAGILQWEAFKNFTMSFTSKYVGKQYFDNTMSSDRQLDAYFVNNVQFDYVIKTKLIKEIGLRFNINNIFDVKYSNDAYGGLWYEQGVEKTWAYYFPQAGINFMGGLSLRF